MDTRRVARASRHSVPKSGEAWPEVYEEARRSSMQRCPLDLERMDAMEVYQRDEQGSVRINIETLPMFQDEPTD